jgi:myosin-5
MESYLRGQLNWHEVEKMIGTIKFELQCLEDNIYHAWVKEAKKRLSKMAVPAVVENQSLPGFITADSGRFFNRLLTGSSQPSFSMDQLLHFLNHIYRTVKCYYLEPSVSTQILMEMLKMIGVSAFNDLLMRKNFASWKRGKNHAAGFEIPKALIVFIHVAMQIQYNITRIEEWCKSHEISEGTLQLEHLMQSTKLLQFKKVGIPTNEQPTNSLLSLLRTLWRISITSTTSAGFSRPRKFKSYYPTTLLQIMK